MANHVEAEHNVLGACLLNPDSYLSIVDKIKPCMFLEARSREVWNIFGRLLSEGNPIDGFLVSQANLSLSTFVGELVSNTPTYKNVEAYANHMVRLWEKRELARVGQQITEMAKADGTPAQAISLLLNMTEQESRGLVAPKERVREVVEYINERHEAGSGLIGHDTGYTELNNVLSGYRGGCVYVVAARPGMGKTAFALNTILPMAKAGNPVLIFSMEMPARELDLRMIAALGRIDQAKVQKADFDEDDWPRFTAAASTLKELPIYVDDTSAQTLAAITAKSKREALRLGQLGGIVIDYIGLMKGESPNRVQEIGAISRGLKALAKDLNCPILELAQLNRNCEDRQDKRPMLADLRDSGDIEQDADVVIMLYRDAAYNPEGILAQGRVAEILVRKNRHGELKEMRVYDNLKYARFDNPTHEIYDIREMQKTTSKSYS